MSKRQRRKREKVRRHEPRHRQDRLARQIATGAGATVGATLLMGGVAHAAPMTFTVGSLADTTGATDCVTPTNTDCTLRQAITDANNNSGADTIVFRSGLTGAINLTGGQLFITDALTIQGPGANQLTVSGNHASRVFAVSNTAATISGLKITAGSAGTDTGGGIYGDLADLTVSDSVVTDSHADNLGGGPQQGAGGGIGVVGAGSSLTVTSSTISGNTAIRGSGVYTASQDGIPTTIRNSTISGNSGASLGGGAYFDYSAPATVENSTIYGNTGSLGGGLYHYGQPGGPGLTVTGSTITHNASNRGGGVASFGNPAYGQPTLRNTIVAGNTASHGPDLSANTGSMNAAFSLIGSVDPPTTINQTIPGSDILGQDPQLGPLANNGGGTMTQKPLSSSPAVDAGSAFGLTTDQRGLVRPFEIPSIANVAGGDGSDTGAVELQAGDVPPAPVATPQKKKKKCKKKKHKRSAESAKKKCKKKKVT